MYKEPRCQVVVGNLVFDQVNSIVIDMSVKELGDKAVVIIPRNYAKLDGKSVLEMMKTGDPVVIKTGYDDDLQVEFTGYLRNIESGVPLRLTIDDAMYPLKRNSFCKSWASVTLKSLLEYVAPGYKIVCPGTSLGPFQINNASSFAVLSAIQRDYGFYTYIKGDTLYCQFPYDVRGTGTIHYYPLYDYPVKKNDLIYSRAEDKKIRVRVTSNQGKGKTLKYETGSKEGEGSLNVSSIPGLTASEVEAYAKAWYKTLAYDGYSGSITGFGSPRTMPGDTLKITDPDEAITGNYLIESVRVTYDLKQGYERENKISFRV